MNQPRGTLTFLCVQEQPFNKTASRKSWHIGFVTSWSEQRDVELATIPDDNYAY